MSWPRKRSPRRIKYEVRDGKHQPVLLERHVLREIMDRLWLQARVKVWQINQPVGGKVQQNVSGIPDLIGFIPKGTWRQTWNVTDGHPLAEHKSPMDYSLPLFIEVKRPGGRHRFMQDRFIEEAREGGAVAFFAESWGDVCREFKKVGIELKEEL